MPFDSWPDEPEEENPEEQWGSPERDLPKVPEIPVPEEPEEVDIDPEVSRTFWVSVFLANVAVAGLALGLMLVYFRNQVALGGGLILLGLFALGRMYLYYRSFRATRAAAESTDAATDGDGADEDD